MDVFVKDFKTYRTIKKSAVINSSLVVDSLDKEVSSISVKGIEINQEDTGNWLIIDRMVYQIVSVTPADSYTNLTLQHPLDAFSRPLELQTQIVNQTIGNFVSSSLRKNWVEQDDTVYAIPYLVVSNLDTTTYVPPNVDNGGCYVLSNYCRLMRKSYRVAVSFSDMGSYLLCTIAKNSPPARNVSFDDGRSLLDSVDYGTSGYAKLTVLHDIKTGEKDSAGNDVYLRETTVWYLSENGEISQLVPSRRAAGEWGALHLKDSTNVEESVIEAFAENRSGHKVSFWSDLDIAVNTECAFVLYGKRLKSYIAYKQKNSTNNRFYYKAGELKTTVTEKLKGVLK